MLIVLAISILIVILVIALTALITTKAYKYKHSVDPIDHLNDNQNQEELNSEKRTS